MWQVKKDTMDNNLGLGTLTLRPVRTVWTNEARDFTPWLANEANIAALGQAIGVELEVEQVEAAVGPYSADILARDTGTGRFVVIENQLEKTDHDHLGKAITYASVLDAMAIVWVATQFTDEHQKALTWLNDHTSEEVSFFGVQLELWAIDDSRPAVRFNVISRPAEIVRQAAATKAAGELTEAKKLQLEFWTMFRDALLSGKAVASAQTPRPQYWYDVALGRSGFHLSNFVNTWEERIGVRVYLNNRIAQAALEILQADRVAIESEIGASLEWDPNPMNRDKTIVLSRQVSLTDRAQWPEYIRWMVEKTVAFRKAFAPRVQGLDLSQATFTSPSSEEKRLGGSPAGVNSVSN